MIIMSLSTWVVTAQEVEKDSVKIKKWEVSANYVYGEFTDDYAEGIYENLGGFGIAASRTVFKEWVGVGVYYKNISSDGTPYVHGYEDPDAKADIKISSWGPELFVTPFKFVKVYLRYGFVNVKEDLYSQIGDDSVDLDGKSFNYGVRFNMKVFKDLNLLLGVENSSIKMDDMDTDGRIDNWSMNFGVGYKF